MSYDIGNIPEGYKGIPKSRSHMAGIFIGIVMDAKDSSQHMGRLKVWIPELGGSSGFEKVEIPSTNGSEASKKQLERNKKYWYTVSYASPFAGATNVRNNGDDATGDTQQSYGMWMVPPDVGNEVLVCFVNGDPNRGYWFGCLYQQNMNQMVPAIGAGKTTDGTVEPVMEYNKKLTDVNYSDPIRPRFAPLADGLKEQGLDTDPRRGSSTTSARRDDASRAFGFVTPRGNSIHIDDGEITGPGGEATPDNEFIRMRTRSGVGITIHETDGFVFITSKNGKSYIEVGDNGVSMYSENPVALRTTGDYNIQSAGDINIDAGGNLNIYATGDIAMGAGGQTSISASGDLVMGSNGDVTMKADEMLLLNSGTIMGLTAGTDSMRYGVQIIDGIKPPQAGSPVPPVRHPMPDGRGGTAAGSSIGSAMPHHQPYDPTTTTNGGNEPVEAGARPTTAQIKAMMKVMYDEMIRLGWSDIGAKAMIAQIGRENDFRPYYMFGNHIDPANKLTNSGMISWQQDRRKKLLAYLKANGAMTGDVIKQEDNSIRAQIQFMDKEMKSSYTSSYNAVRDRTAQYRSVEVVLSNNYVRWARNGTSNGKFTKADAGRALAKMDGYYASVSSVVAASKKTK